MHARLNIEYPLTESRIFSNALAPIVAGNLEVRLVQDEAEIVATQKLRYRIFCGELGATLSSEVQAQERDFDEFDDVCDHVLVIDHERTGEQAVVGTYRLLRSSAMQKLGRFYTESEYNIDALKAQNLELMELGRSCVDINYRNRAVMSLLWRGIGAYIDAYDIKLMFGCASFTGSDPAVHQKALSYLYHKHRLPEHLMVHALPKLHVPMDTVPMSEIDEREIIRSIPPLIKGYLRLGGLVGNGAVIDYACNTTDVAIVVQSDTMQGKYTDRYRGEE